MLCLLALYSPCFAQDTTPTQDQLGIDPTKFEIGQPLGFFTGILPGDTVLNDRLHKIYKLFNRNRRLAADSLLHHLQDSFQLVERADSARSRLRLALVEASMLETKQRLPEALALTKVLLADRSLQAQRDLLLQAYLITELIHEHLGNKDYTQEYLDKARPLLGHPSTRKLEAAYYIRKTSDLRSLNDTALARRVLDSAMVTALAQRDAYNAGDAFFLQAVMNADGTAAIRLANLQRSLVLLTRAHAHLGACYTHISIMRTLSEMGRHKEALRVSDDMLAYSERYLDGALPDERYAARFYDLRAELFEAVGQLDSALAAERQASSLYVQAYQVEAAAEVVAIEQGYAVRESQQEVERQRELLEQSQRRRRLLYIAIGILALVGGILTVLSLRLSASRRQVIQEVERQTVLRGEMQHRVKNNLEVLISLLDRQRRSEATSQEARDALEAATHRVYALAGVHSVLNAHDGEDRVPARAYLRELVANLTHLHEGTARQPMVEVQCSAELHIERRRLMPIGLIANELLTNTTKHAVSPAGQPLRVLLRLEARDREIWLAYLDNGTCEDGAEPYAWLTDQDYRAEGMGAYLVTQMTRQLRASMSPLRENGWCGIQLRFNAAAD